MPELYIITGSNGAGKSSMGQSYIPSHILATSPTFDGDKLYMQKSVELWQSGIRANKQIKEAANDFVAETFSKKVEQAIKNKAHFSYEGHFTEDTSWDIPKQFKAQGYVVNLIFFGLSTPDESELRVLERVRDGGHHVPRLMIENNFYGNLLQLNRHFSLVDSLLIFDTSKLEPVLICEMTPEKSVLTVPEHQIPDWFRNYLPGIVHAVELQQQSLKRKRILPPDDNNGKRLKR